MALLITDPVDLLLDEDGDLFVDENGFAFAVGGDGIKQLIQIRLLLFMGEWFLNLEAGVPWYQEILGEKFNEPLLRQRLTEQILAVPGVAELIGLTLSFTSDRKVSITYEVRAVFGDTIADTLALPGGS